MDMDWIKLDFRHGSLYGMTSGFPRNYFSGKDNALAGKTPLMASDVTRSTAPPPSQTHGSEQPQRSYLNRLRRLPENLPSQSQLNRRIPLPAHSAKISLPSCPC
ncbi:hypothetical protein EVAR_43421_1 [Eumeta japonica]|uniref:Uncharacterized protein n=1 Tax=Eumeta variegata TaxID=151549 RepID=A0A4C1WWK0_EUMVA|nr:hypothetical protein EVAR_43421_1 [Eumeta japonica]